MVFRQYFGAPGLSALALFLAFSGTVLPAAAAKRDRPTQISIPDTFRLAARQARTTLAAGDVTGAEAQITALQPVSPLEKYIVGGLRMELASRRNDPQAQRRALTEMLESQGAPEAEVPYLRYLAGYYSYFLGEHDDAIAQVSYARQLGYAPVETTVLLADATLKKGKRTEGLALVEQAMAEQRAAGKPIPAAWFDRAAALSYAMNDWAGVAKWYQQKLALYPSTGNWRTSLSNVLAAPDLGSQVQLDLYRLQAATGAMASERDYQAYAQLAAKNGFEAEAKAVIESARSAGKLTASETVTAALLKSITPKAKKDIAALPAQAKKAEAANDGAPAMKVADTYLSLAQYPQAAALYRLALLKGGVDTARVNSRLGIALARSGDLAGARAQLAQSNGEWANVAGFWNVWVDQQAQRTASFAPPPVVPTL